MTEQKAQYQGEVKAWFEINPSISIQFFASLPPIQSALKISGDGDNLRAQLDIPIRITPDGLKLALFTQKRLLVTVQELPDILTKFDDETKKDTEGSGTSVDRRRFTKRRDKQTG